MKRRFSSAIAGVGTLAVAAGIVLSTGVAAYASTPTWEPDATNEVGSIALYNASGVQVTGGNLTDSPIAAYAVGSANPLATTNINGVAKLNSAQPDPGQANPALWNTDQLSGGAGSGNYPVTTAGAPAAVKNLPTTEPVVTGASGDLSVANFIDEFPNSDPTGLGCTYSATPAGCTNTNYENIYQLRIYTQDSTGTYSAKYDVADIMVTGQTYTGTGASRAVSGGTWTQVYPGSTATTVGSSENPSVQGDNVTFTATEVEADGITHPAGSIQFTIDGSAAGTPQTVSAGGVATFATSSLAVGNHPVTATFTPTASGVTGSTGTLAGGQTVTKQLIGTTTTLSFDGHQTTANTATTLSGTVTAADSSIPAGTVSFFDGTSVTPLNSSPITVTAGSYSWPDTAGFASGTHSVVAKFTPTDTTTYNASQSAPVNFFTQGATAPVCSQTGSQCTDVQNIQGEIPVGTLVISTPYSGTNVLDIGTLALDSTGDEWTGNAPFKCITVTDATSSGAPFVASAQASTLTGPGTNAISGENVGLTNLAPAAAPITCPDGSTPAQSYSKAVTPTNVPAATPVVASSTDPGTLGLGNAPHTILTGTAGGEGTSVYDGTITLNAPTSAQAGTYTGTVTFTVTD
jgi:Big-like domain-containing protein